MTLPTTPAPFIHNVRVYFEDTDAGGIVYYANYIKFFERARTEWLRSLGIEQHRMALEHGVMFVVRDVACTYHRSALLDDWLEVTAQVTKAGRASVELAQECRVQREGQSVLLAQGQIRIGCVDRHTLRPQPMPSHIYQTIAALT